jgi:hypothetical protein
MAEEQREEHEPHEAHQPVFARPPLDSTDEELEAFATDLVDAVLDESKGPDSRLQLPRRFASPCITRPDY